MPYLSSETNTQEYLLYLNHLFYDRPQLMVKIYQQVPMLSDFKAQFSQLINRLSNKNKAVIQERKQQFQLELCLQKIRQQQITLLTIEDNRYPPLLKEISDPPLLLYLKGSHSILNGLIPCLAVVGTRNPSPEGISITQTLCSTLSSVFVITSGLAKGIDSSAHLQALRQNKPTIAVLGCGVNLCYPAENQPLYRQISENGLLISEFPLDTQPSPQHFPQRNRLISGLSQGVVVIEAKARSGALITARHAYESNRDVFALPGSVLSPLSEGPHQLIRDGAVLIRSAQDILDAYQINPALSPEPVEKKQSPTPSGLDETEQHIWKQLSETPLHIDTIAHLIGLSIPETLSKISLLELKAPIQKLPGNQFIIQS